MYVIFSCGKHIHKHPCLSVSLSVRPSVPAFASTSHHRLPWYFIIWLDTTSACGSQIFKVMWQISRSHRPKKLVKRVKLRVFGHFLENAWGKGLNPDHLIKSSRYTGGDFIYLYRFVRRRRRPQILVHAITFEQLLRFLSFFDDCWPWPIDYLIRFWSILVVPLSNMIFAISQSKMVRLPKNEKQTHLLNSRPQMWPSGLTLTMTMTLTFQGQIWNLLYLSQKWCDCHKTKSKHID